MTQWVSVLATNPGNLRGVSGTHRMEGDKKTVESCPLTSTYAVTCAHLHACTYSQMNKYNKHSCRKISRLDMSYSVVKCRFPSLLSHFLVLCHLKSQQKSLSKPRLPASLTQHRFLIPACSAVMTGGLHSQGCLESSLVTHICP